MRAPCSGAPAAGSIGSLDPGRFLVAFYLSLSLGVIVPVMIWWSTGAAEGIAGPSLAWVVAFLAGLRLGLLSVGGATRILSATFWIFVYVWLGIAPLAQLLRGEFPHAGVYPRRIVVLAYLIVLIGLVSYEGGRFIAQRRSGLGRGFSRLLDSRSVSVNRIFLISAAAVLVSGYLIVQLGGARALLASRQDVFMTVEEFSAGQYQERLQVVLRLLRVPPFVATYLLWSVWLRRRTELGYYSRLVLWVLLLASGATCCLVSNPVNSARYWFGTIVLSLLFATMPWRKSWSFTLLTVVLCGALLFVFPYADLFRREVSAPELRFAGIEPLVSKSDYDGYQQLLNAILFVEDEGLSYGRQLTGTALFWVPRKFWAGKPEASGGLVAEASGYTFTNLSMPLWGEGYLDGGFLLVIVLLGAYGFGSGVLELLFVTGHRSRDHLVNYLVPVLAAYQIFLLRGALLSAFAYLVPVLILIGAATRRRTVRAHKGASLAAGQHEMGGVGAP